MIKNTFDFFRAVILIRKYGSQIVFDSLTGLLTRSAFQVTIAKEVARARRHGSIFSLVFVDVDNLKQVNDQQGHLAGDKLIQQVAQLLESCCRGSDYVFRYGGDEFIMLLPETNNAGVTKFEELLEERLEGSSFSFSFGSSTWQDKTKPEKMIQLADVKMYERKIIKKALSV